MRYHELAVAGWLNRIFLLRSGYPVPVVFTSPMDAFSLFNKLWAEASNPFQYLLDIKDENGAPLYQPYPQPVRYPVISVYRKGWKLRPHQNFSTHRMRHINWPTVSNTGTYTTGVNSTGTNVTMGDLGNVTTSRFPMAFDYRFQIDHFCNRPDTQAFFIGQAFREFWRTGGPQMQTWTVVNYPGFGRKLIRLYVDGDIENLTPEEPEDGKNVEFRTSFNVVMEGYDIDLDYEIYPALWKLVINESSASPGDLAAIFDFSTEIDMRNNANNPIVNYRKQITTMPPSTPSGAPCPQPSLLRTAPSRQASGSPTPTGLMFTGSVNPNGVQPGRPGDAYIQIINGVFVEEWFKATGVDTTDGWQ